MTLIDNLKRRHAAWRDARPARKQRRQEYRDVFRARLRRTDVLWALTIALACLLLSLLVHAFGDTLTSDPLVPWLYVALGIDLVVLTLALREVALEAKRQEDALKTKHDDHA